MLRTELGTKNWQGPAQTLSLPSWNLQSSSKDGDLSKQSHRLMCICKCAECSESSEGQLQGTKNRGPHLDPKGDFPEELLMELGLKGD